MNILQLHHKVTFFLDSVNSPRFNTFKKDESLNTAIMDIILDRYDNIRKAQKDYAFQTSQRLRDELYTLVKKQSNLSASGGIIPKTNFPSDYMLLLSMKANISGTWINTIPVTYDEYNILELNPYTYPSIEYPERIYRIESQQGVEIRFGDVGTLIAAEIFYLARPARVSIGTTLDSTSPTIYKTAVPEIIAYTDGILRLVMGGGGGGGATDDLGDKSIKKGEKYIIGTYSEVGVQIISGIFAYDYTECDLPEVLHEEICRKAAQVLSGNVENYNRSQSLTNDIKNNEN
jgi:hypothetical protein